MNVDDAVTHSAAEQGAGPKPITFARVIDTIVESFELSLEGASLEWVPLPVLFGLAQAAGWTQERLAAEIDRQLGAPDQARAGLALAPDKAQEVML